MADSVVDTALRLPLIPAATTQLDAVRTFMVVLDKHDGESLGLTVVTFHERQTLLVQSLSDIGVIPSWNEAQANTSDALPQVKVGDFIIDVNGCAGDSQLMMEQLKQNKALHITVQHAPAAPASDAREDQQRERERLGPSPPTPLQELLKRSRVPEELDDYACSRCAHIAEKAGIPHERSSVSQTSGLFTETRDVLVIVLNRFSNISDDKGRFRPVKDRTQIAVPTVLSLEAGEYRLYGVVSHIGTSLAQGHYVADVRSLRDHQWYHCDDTAVNCLNVLPLYEVAEVTTLSKGADPYVLFYHRFREDMDIPA